MAENKLPAGITEEMVAQAKEKYGDKKVKIAELPKDDNGDEFLSVLVRVPDRKTLDEFEKWMDKSPGKAKEILLNACLLSHKDEVKADDGLFLSAVEAIAQLIPIRKAVIKNC